MNEVKDYCANCTHNTDSVTLSGEKHLRNKAGLNCIAGRIADQPLTEKATLNALQNNQSVCNSNPWKHDILADIKRESTRIQIKQKKVVTAKKKVMKAVNAIRAKAIKTVDKKS
jgi:hypothetical protein